MCDLVVLMLPPTYHSFTDIMSRGGGARDSIAGHTHTGIWQKESLMLLEGESTAGLDSMSVAGTPELVLWQRRTRLRQDLVKRQVPRFEGLDHTTIQSILTIRR